MKWRCWLLIKAGGVTSTCRGRLEHWPRNVRRSRSTEDPSDHSYTVNSNTQLWIMDLTTISNNLGMMDYEYWRKKNQRCYTRDRRSYLLKTEELRDLSPMSVMWFADLVSAKPFISGSHAILHINFNHFRIKPNTSSIGRVLVVSPFTTYIPHNFGFLIFSWAPQWSTQPTVVGMCVEQYLTNVRRRRLRLTTVRGLVGGMKP